MSWNHTPQHHPVVDNLGRRTSQSLEGRKNKPDVYDCVAAAVRFEQALQQWRINTGKKAPHALVGAVAVSALTEEYMHLNDPRLPLGKQRIARDTKDVDLDLNYDDVVGLWEAIGGKVIGESLFEEGYKSLPGGYGPGRFVMRGESALWQALAPWKGDVPFDVHSSSFRLDNYFGSRGITFSTALDATRQVSVKNDRGHHAAWLTIYRGPLLLLLKLDAWPRAAHPIHKDLRDLRLLVEGHGNYLRTLHASSSKPDSPFDLERDKLKRYLDLLTSEHYALFLSKVEQLVAQPKIAGDMAEWELMEEIQKEKNSRQSYDTGVAAMARRYRKVFEWLEVRFMTSRHHPTQQQQSLAKANPYDPVPRSLYRTSY
ncbi:hypothetical protein JCM6882_001008 [Rhodosporidiobolus microsporus]